MNQTQREWSFDALVYAFVAVLIACPSFETWSNFFGPVQVPSIDGNFTSIITPNYNDRISTYPFNLTRPLTGRRQVFDAENIVLL